ncbi:response regulator [Bdellovibrio sp. HCB117]|uniref:response regulator n=1 Tax=Bdellovibrio sp. HCB117 TaxID=3394359 RepID=UPI0039B66833
MTENFEKSSRFTTLKTFFLVAAVLIVFNSILLLNVFRNIRQQQVWVQHTANVISELDLLMSAVKDAETGVRGFLLTNRKDYLDPYFSGVKEARERYQNLRSLTIDNPRQQASLNDIEKTLTDREEAFKSSLRKLSAVGEDAALPGEGKIVMDKLRDQVTFMKNEEQRLLKDRQQKAQSSEDVGFISWFFSVAVNLALTGTAFYLIRRSWRQQGAENARQTRETWMKSRLAEVSAILAEDLNMAEMGDKVLHYLCRFLQIPAARLYITEGDSLVLKATYAESKAFANRKIERIKIGETLLGEAVQKDEMFKVRNVPPGYLQIESSLGITDPKSILFFPIYQYGKPVGILEFALFRDLTDDERTLLNSLREVVAVGINTAHAKEDLQRLLNTTQEQALELQAQQEELRASNEELEEQARALEAQQENLNSKNRELEFSRKEVEAKALDLEKTNQYKSEFLAKMSHELRTPLNSLLILATLLKENKEGNLNEQQIGFASTIYDAGNDLLGLISDILDISKIEARKLTLRAEKFTMGHLISQLQATFLPQTNKKNLRLVIDASEEVKAVQMNTDLQRVEQILRNFLSNAVKFTEKGSITIKAEQSSSRDGFVTIKIIDTGIGISEEKRITIFEAFEQADSSISRRYGGTGLGLTISRELTSLLGGQVYVDSEVGYGSAFTLEIPQTLPGAHSLSQTQAASQQVVKYVAPSRPERSSVIVDEKVSAMISSLEPRLKTLLVVEDDEATSRLIAQTAKGYGYQSLEVNSGELALAVLKEYVPTAIMLDIKLPGISGVGLLETIKQMPRLRHVPVHMISALDYQHNTMRMGAMGYLAKPTSIKDVSTALSQIETLISKKARSLLVVEDDQAQRDAIISLVQGLDLKIVGASHGQEALEHLNNETFDCVVLDLALPDMSGAEFLDKLNAISSHLPPVIIYTGQDLSRDEEAALRQYAESIILKGVRSPERLLDEVNLFLHRVEEDLPEQQRDLLKQLRSREQSFEGKTVLLVDDDLRNLFSLTHVLEGKGFKVVVARDGVEALEKLEVAQKVDVILMDIMMPRLDGYETIRKIREKSQYETTPIIALTAKAMKGDHEKCIQVGANDYLPKPINLGSLVSVLKVWVSSLETIV